MRKTSTIVRQVKELIAALDRRRPQPGRADEEGIALESASLRDRAVARLEELESTPARRSGRRR